jgi:tetratricopeptide (TPR) repeat protein
VAEAHGVPVPRALHLRRARYLTLLGRGDDAGAERDRAAGRAPTPLDHFLAALGAYRRGDVARAAAGCDAVLQQQPHHFWSRYLLALCRLRDGRWDAARDGLTACLADWPDSLWPRLFRAQARLGLGDLRGAEGDCNAALGRAGDDPLARYLALSTRGTLRARQQRGPAAAADLEEAVRLRPDLPEAYLNLARVHEGGGRLNGAVALLGQGPGPGPLAAANVALACAGAQREQLTAAAAVLGRGLARCPGDARLYRARAEMYASLGDRRAARSDLWQAITHEARLRGAAGWLAAAPPAGRPTLQLADDFVRLAQLQHRDGDEAAALLSCGAALYVWPDHAPALLQCAEVLLATKNYAAAGDALDRYLRHARPTAVVLEVRGQIHARLRQYAAARDAYEWAARLRPDARTLLDCGWVHLQLDEPQPALTRAEQAVRLRPRDPEVLLQAACVCAQASRLLQARGAAPAERAGEQARALLYRLAEQVVRLPERERRAFWRDRVEPERALDPVRLAPEFVSLKAACGQ